ncbi:hypothetical protein [Cohnella cellulosilytica]|uniref:LTXXQ motif family protein n=1 Tax=Cohnella cellulosilytica TaxID=986710 RepID=A0ABW2FKD7_9BACL
MRRFLYALLTLTALAVAVPTLASAHPGEPHRHERSDKPSIDWSALPADIQALKTQLDQIRTEQKNLFRQMKSQNEQIREARKTLTTEKRNSLKKPAKQLIDKMRVSKEAIHDMRDRKRESWDSFREHSENKQWVDAKSDLEAIVKQKRQILQNQQNIVRLQKQLLTLISPSAQS